MNIFFVIFNWYGTLFSVSPFVCCIMSRINIHFLLISATSVITDTNSSRALRMLSSIFIMNANENQLLKVTMTLPAVRKIFFLIFIKSKIYCLKKQFSVILYHVKRILYSLSIYQDYYELSCGLGIFILKLKIIQIVIFVELKS